MGRIRLMVVSVILALVVAAPMALAQSQGGAPGDAGGTIVVNPGDYPGSCNFPFSLDLSGKGKTIELPYPDLAGPRCHHNEPRQSEAGIVQHHRLRPSEHPGER